MPAIILTSIITSLATVLVTTLFQYCKEKKLNQKRMRLELLGQVMGNIQLLRQLYVSRFEAYLHCNYHEELWHRNGEHAEFHKS